MGPILSSLLALQKIELELRKTKLKLKLTRQAVLAQKKKIDQLNATLQAKQEEIKLTRIQSDKLELELKTQEAEIAKFRVALNTAKTNKDYSAILTRINTDKADKAKFEDQILGFMTQIETDQSACREIEQEIQTESQRLQEVENAAVQKEKTIQLELDKLTQQREKAADQVPPKERILFERLTDRYDGEVLVGISQVNNRRTEHTCGGCFMSIPLESVNSLMMRDEVVTCPSCGRILVLEDALKQETTA